MDTIWVRNEPETAYKKSPSQIFLNQLPNYYLDYLPAQISSLFSSYLFNIVKGPSMVIFEYFLNLPFLLDYILEMQANTLHMIFILGLWAVSCQPNMFIDGDFERFVVTNVLIYANDTPWYDISGVDTTIQVQTDPRYSNVMEIFNNHPTYFCQNLPTLIPKMMYRLEFDYALRNQATFNTIDKFNGVVVLNTIHPLQSPSIHFSTAVPAVSGINIFCIGGISPSGLNLQSSLVDNFSLILLPSYDLNISVSEKSEKRLLVETNLEWNSMWNMTQFCSLFKAQMSGVVVSGTKYCSLSALGTLNLEFETIQTLAKASDFVHFSFSFSNGSLINQTTLSPLYFNLSVTLIKSVDVSLAESDHYNKVNIKTNLLPDPLWDSSLAILQRKLIQLLDLQTGSVDVYYDEQGDICYRADIEESVAPKKALQIEYSTEITSQYGYKIIFDIDLEDSQAISYYDKNDIILINSLNGASAATINVASQSFGIWSMLGVNYLLCSLLGFFNLTFFYILLPLHSMVLPIRRNIVELFRVFESQTDITQIITKIAHRQPGDNFLRFVPEQAPYELWGFEWIREFGFQYNVGANIYGDFATLILFLVKVLLVYGLTLLPSNFLSHRSSRFIKYSPIMFNYEVAFCSPSLFVAMGSMLNPHFEGAIASFSHKLNNGTLIFTCFFFLFITFYVPVCLIMVQKSKKNPNKLKAKLKKRVNTKIRRQIASHFSKKKPFNRKQIVSALVLPDLCMYWIIPFLAGLRSLSLFLLPLTLLTTSRLWLVLRHRAAFPCFQFVKEICNKSVWFCFNLIFLFLWYVDLHPQLYKIKYSNSAIKISSSLVIVIFLLGGVFEAVFLLGDLIIFIRRKIKKCLNNSINPQEKQDVPLKFKSKIVSNTMQKRQRQKVKLSHFKNQNGVNKLKVPTQLGRFRPATKSPLKTKKHNTRQQRSLRPNRNLQIVEERSEWEEIGRRFKMKS